MPKRFKEYRKGDGWGINPSKENRQNEKRKNKRKQSQRKQRLKDKYDQ
jgi:hypothetical protein|tara:strand:- start:1844 stop:1987 length:144 start_codon:yes stop_codon:yes gene_type:complete